jgi:hypothetical protein
VKSLLTTVTDAGRGSIQFYDAVIVSFSMTASRTRLDHRENANNPIGLCFARLDSNQRPLPCQSIPKPKQLILGASGTEKHQKSSKSTLSTIVSTIETHKERSRKRSELDLRLLVLDEFGEERWESRTKIRSSGFCKLPFAHELNERRQ